MCGIVGIYSFDKSRNVVPMLMKSLMDLQNRGQLSAGISTYNDERKRTIQTYKNNGKVDEVFQVNHRNKFNDLKANYAGHIGIGHTRYATSGDDSDSLAQPFERPHGRLSKWFSIAFNGNLANYSSLKLQLESVGYNMTYDSDTEVIMHYLSREMQKNTPTEELNFKDILSRLDTEFDGAWNLCFVNGEGRFFASRDKHGFHPLSYGVGDNFVIVASESTVITNLHLTAYDIPPGSMLTTNDTGFDIVPYIPIEHSFCFFEYIYFANNTSVQDDVSMYSTREQIGRTLASEEILNTKDKEYIVVPVPDTSYVAGNEYASELQLPYILAIIKNHQVGRTFISGQDRMEKIRLKFSFVKEKLKGKRIILIDDSIVRGSTLRGLVSVLKDWCEVAEVHVRIGCPPIVAPCFYGIDFPTIEELYAGKDAPNAEDFNADSLKYISMNGLLNSINKDSHELCTSCISNVYPTSVGRERYEKVKA